MLTSRGVRRALTPHLVPCRYLSTTAVRHHAAEWLAFPPRAWDVSTLAPEVVISTSLDPIFNLALEERLMRSRGSRLPKSTDCPVHSQPGLGHCATTLYLYRNAPCLVVGRNQNPWMESNSRAMRLSQPPIQLVRRRSGGGAVYHDEGNTNYSIHLPREHFDRSSQAHIIARALNGAPFNLSGQRGVAPDAPADPPPEHFKLLPRGVYINERNDICLSLLSPTARAEEARTISVPPEIDHEPETVALRKPFERKLSGSAYKITSSRAYHHGTMLLTAQLERLGGSLSSPFASSDTVHVTSKGVSSVRAPVTSLAQAFAHQDWSHNAFVAAVSTEFVRSHSRSMEEAQIHVVDQGLLNADLPLREIFQDLSKWDWIFGQTPEFTLCFTLKGQEAPAWLSELDMSLTVRQGRILHVELERLVMLEHPDVRDALVHWWTKDLLGTPFDALVVPPPVSPSFTPLPSSDLRALDTQGPGRLETMKREWLAWFKTVL